MKTAIITGASRGIGKAAALALADQGYHLVINCVRNQNELEKVKMLCLEKGISCITSVGDVGSFAYCKELVDLAVSEFGKIDLLINNAGVCHIGLLQDMTPEDWNRVMGTDLTGVFNLSNLVIPHMVKAHSGRILNISSVWGNVGASCEAAYSAAKGGVNSLTKALAKELAPSNIAVNAIACGAVATEMNACFSEEELKALCDEIPAGRMASPEEIGELIVHIAACPVYLTGQIITADGGWT